MKKIAVGFGIGIAFCLLLAADRLGLYQTFLQSNLDGGGQSVTNLNSLTATNLTSSSNTTALFFTVSGATNQVIFGATNTAPVNTTNPVYWISVQVAGSNNVLRLPVYQ
jgi:hypothetical protein